MEWRKIETAPRDGTEVLVWRKGWVHAEQAWYRQGQWRNDGAGHFQEPTHWMPLPDPPSPPEAP